MCRSLFARVSFGRIVSLYYPLHETDVSIFLEQLDLLMTQLRSPQTNLARIRLLHRLSQSELARVSGVGLKSIQAYEQRVNSLNKASGHTLQRLSSALDCSIESLLEYEPGVIVDYLS